MRRSSATRRPDANRPGRPGRAPARLGGRCTPASTPAWRAIRRTGWLFGTAALAAACGDPPRTALDGRGDASASDGSAPVAELACRPEAVEFGRVPTGQSAERSVECENRGSEPITVRRVRWDDGAAGEFSIALDVAGAVLDIPVDGAPAGGRVVARIGYRPTTPDRDEATALLEWAAPSAPAGRRRIPVTGAGIGEGFDIDVRPTTVDSGPVPLNTSVFRQVVVRNAGVEPLVIESMRLDDGGQGAFGSPDAGFTVVAPGESQLVTLEFRPAVAGPAEGRLILRSNDPDEPEVVVGLRGEGRS